MKETGGLSKWSTSSWPTSNNPYGSLPINLLQHHLNGEKLNTSSTQPSNDLNNGYWLSAFVVYSTAIRKFDILLNEVVLLRFLPVCTIRNLYVSSFFCRIMAQQNKHTRVRPMCAGNLQFTCCNYKAKATLLYYHVAVTALSFLLSLPPQVVTGGKGVGRYHSDSGTQKQVWKFGSFCRSL
jgi:hypothetical protein